MPTLGHHSDRSASFLVKTDFITAGELAALLPPSTIRTFLASAPPLSAFVAQGAAFTGLGAGTCAYQDGTFRFDPPGAYALRIALAHSLGP